jgi:hypothetical protein
MMQAREGRDMADFPARAQRAAAINERNARENAGKEGCKQNDVDKGGMSIEH